MEQFLKKILNGRLITAFLMGISAGLPLLLTMTLMQAWAKDANVSLKEIGLMSLVGIPYTVKFLWSPIFDRFTLPFLGRRRGWLLIVQILLILSIVGMGLTSPMNLTSFVIVAFLITFFSASQDIVIDAYRREDLLENELGLGSSYYVYGYRVGMLMVSGGGMILSDYIPWKYVFFVMAACMSVGLITTLFCHEPKVVEAAPKNLRESVIDPFVDYLKRPSAITILIFILLYKLGDNLALALTTPFYLELGFTKTEIGTVVKLFGFWATMAGSILGGIIILKIGINRALWIFGFLQMFATLGFAILSKVGNSVTVLSSVVIIENLATAMATAAFVGFMASITNKKFTATQYALLSSLMGVPRVFISASSGFLAESMGWFNFFIFCTVVAIPGLALLFKFAPYSQKIKEKSVT
ncbi:MAG: AmpG family muropeptide MFS transporter [Bacteriovoracaceae bacterium]